MGKEDICYICGATLLHEPHERFCAIVKHHEEVIKVINKDLDKAIDALVSVGLVKEFRP